MRQRRRWGMPRQPGLAHQASHSVAATPLAGVLQLLPDPGTADDAVRLGMELMNPGE